MADIIVRLDRRGAARRELLRAVWVFGYGELCAGFKLELILISGIDVLPPDSVRARLRGLKIGLRN